VIALERSLEIMIDLINTHNNSIKDSPQKDVGLDAQKAARPLLLGVRRQIDEEIINKIMAMVRY